MSINFLCIAEELKGEPFMRTLREAGCKVFVVTREKSQHKPWPMEYIDELFVQPDSRDKPHDRQTMIAGTAWLMQEHGIDRVVALDDFDVEDAALIREEFRIPGMGQTTARHFRDKLAMRMLAQEHGIPSPAFSAMFRRHQVDEFCAKAPGPYVIKPRSEASALGIRKVDDSEEALRVYDELGEDAYRFLIECFAPGQVFHVDALVREHKVQFVRSSAYVDPPLSIVQGGGTFQTRTLDPASADSQELAVLTGRVMKAFGLRFSASHTEWIRDAQGRFLFLETSSRVGGAHISDMLAHATGVNLWAEWAKLELAELTGAKYTAPEDNGRFAAVTIRTVGQEWPQLQDIHLDADVQHVPKRYHAAVVLSSDKLAKVEAAQTKLYHELRGRFG